MNMFVIDRMSKILHESYDKNSDDNLKILFGDDFELNEKSQIHDQLNSILQQLQYNLQSPHYMGNKDEIIGSNIESLKRKNTYFSECSVEYAIEILQTLDLYTSK